MTMEPQDIAIMYSGGTDSLAVYALAAAGHSPDLPPARKIHLLHMRNGMERFPDFPRTRYEVAKKILRNQVSDPATFTDSSMVELDMGRLFQGLWLDRYEELMPRYNGKNLVCVACKLAMHTRAILYCNKHFVGILLTGYTKKQSYYPEQTAVFMDKITAFGERFGVKTRFPVYDAFAEQLANRHYLEEFGLPSTGGGERKCLFCQTLTTATETEIGMYLDDMIPRVIDYMEHHLAGRISEAAAVFPPGR